MPEKPSASVDGVFTASVHDHPAAGRHLRVLTIVDVFSRFAPALDPRFSDRGEDAVATLDRVCAGNRINASMPAWTMLPMCLSRPSYRIEIILF